MVQIQRPPPSFPVGESEPEMTVEPYSYSYLGYPLRPSSSCLLCHTFQSGPSSQLLGPDCLSNPLIEVGKTSSPPFLTLGDARPRCQFWTNHRLHHKYKLYGGFIHHFTKSLKAVCVVVINVCIITLITFIWAHGYSFLVAIYSYLAWLAVFMEPLRNSFSNNTQYW